MEELNKIDLNNIDDIEQKKRRVVLKIIALSNIFATQYRKGMAHYIKISDTKYLTGVDEISNKLFISGMEIFIDETLNNKVIIGRNDMEEIEILEIINF